MSRPDGGQDELGSRVLDEPSAKQSDPTVLDLHLRAITKEANVKPVVSMTVCIGLLCWSLPSVASSSLLRAYSHPCPIHTFVHM